MSRQPIAVLDEYLHKPHCKKIFIILLQGILLGLSSCSGLEQSEQGKIRGQNAKGEYIYRRHDEKVYRVDPPQKREREPYPWEQQLS